MPRDACACGGTKDTRAARCNPCRWRDEAAAPCPDCGSKKASKAARCRPCYFAHQRKRLIEKNGYIGEGATREHRRVMEQVLDRPLSRDEHVHHKNGLKWDNRPENLEVLSTAEHGQRHVKCITDEQIADLLRSGVPGIDIAKQYHVWTWRIVRVRREIGLKHNERVAKHRRRWAKQPGKVAA